MTQQIIDFGAFPNDPAADGIRDAFAKVQNNFTDLYSATLNTGVQTVKAGPGLAQNRTTGNVVLSANISNVTIQTTSGLQVGVGAATGTSATISSFNTPFVIGLAPDITVANITATSITGTLKTGAQPNITSVGTLANLTVTGDIRANSFIGNIIGNISGTVVAPGANTQIIFNNRGNLGGTTNLTYTGTTLSLTGAFNVVGNITARNVNGGNLISANYFQGTFLGPASNSATVSANAQPNITSLGTLTTLQVAGTLQAPDIAGNVTGNLVGTVTGNLVGTAANSVTVTASAQPNITSLGTLTLLNVAGNADIGNLNALTISGAIVSSSQPNIRQVGLLDGLAVSGNMTGGNITLTGDISAANMRVGIFTAESLAGNLTGNVAGNLTGNVTGNMSGNMSGNVSGNISGEVTGNISGNISGNIAIPGANTYVVFNDGGNANTHSGLAYNRATSLLSITGNVSSGNLTSTGIMVATGNVSGANLTTGGVVSATGNVSGGNLVTNGLLSVQGNANIGNITAVNSITGNVVSISGNVSGANLIASGVLSVAGTANVGNLSTAGDITSDGNITGNTITVNTLTTLTLVSTGNISGSNIATGGILSVSGNASTGNLSTGIIVATGNINGGASTNITIGGSFTTTTGTVQSAILKSTTANVTGTANVGNLVTSGTISATGTISASGNINANASTINANNINVSSTIQGTSLAATYGLNVGGTANMAHVVLPSVTNIGVVAITNTGTTVTVTTNGNHGMTVGGAQFTLAGTTASTNPPNGTYIVATVPTTVTNIAVSSVTYSGNVITVTTASPHGMAARTSITIAGITASTNAPNGTFVIATAPTTTTFTYVASSVPTGTLAGTITLTLPGTSTFTYTAATAPTGAIGVSVAVLIIKPLMTSTGSGSFGGDLSAANLSTGGGLTVTGTANVGNIGTLHVTASGNLYANSGILFANIANANTINASLLAAGNLYANAGLMQASNATFTSTLNAANFIANGTANFTGALVRMSGNANIDGNIDKVTHITASGNVQANNMTIGNTFAAGSLSTANTVTAGTANIGHLTLPTVTLTGTSAISSIAYIGTTIRVTTVAPHGMSVIGASIAVTNTTATTNAPNGPSFTVTNIVNEFKFDYLAPSTPTNTPGGTIGVGASTSIVIKPVLTSTGSGAFGGGLSVTGNANTGNIGTTHIVASGDINASTGTLSANIANANVINTTDLNSTNLYANSGLMRALNSRITGNLTTANFAANGNAEFTGTVVKMVNANISGSIDSVTHITSSGNIVTTTGLIASLNSNVTGLLNANNATINNISTLGLLNVRGNANVGNVGMLHITAAGNVNASGSMNVTGTANVGNLTFPAATTVTGSITATYSSTTITVTCASGHNLAVGNEVVLSGITAATNAPNGVYLIASVPASPTVASTRTITVESLTYSTTTITVTTTTPHLLTTGATVTISGVTSSTNPPNVTNSAITVTNATQFTYTVVSAPTGTIGGTISLTTNVTRPTTFTVVAPVAPTGTLSGTIVVTVRPVITSAGSGLFDGRLKVGGNAEILGNLSSVTNIFASGNINSDGTLNVKNITANTLFTFTGSTANVSNVVMSSGNITLSGNVSASSIVGTGVIQLTGTGNSNFAGNLGAPHMFVTGNVEGGILKSSGIMTAAGNMTVGSASSAHTINGLLTVAGNANVGNITTKDIDGTLIRVSGNVSGANLVASGILSVAGTANVGNLNLPSTLIPLLAGGGAIGYSGTTITVTTQNNHGLSVGTEITLTGVSGGTPPNVNQNGNPGWFVITAVPSLTTFTFTAVAPTSALNSTSASLNARPFMVSTGSASYGGNIGASGRVTAASFSGNGSLLTNIPGSAVGKVSSASTADTAGSALTAGSATTSGTVTSANQPNITAVGSLISLVVAGNQNNGGNVAVTATSGTGTVVTLSYANPGYVPFYIGQNVTVSGLAPAGYNGTVTVTSASATGITYNGTATGAMTSAAGAGRIVGTAISMTPAGNINAQYISANGSLLTSINGGNVSKVGSANTADTSGTVTNASQANITSVGTLTSLSVSGAFSGAGISGTNITASGFMLQSVGVGLSATGTTQGTALSLTKTVNVISGATANLNDGIKLPATAIGVTCIIINISSAAVKVYPNDGATIDGLTANSPFSLGSGAKLMFVATSATQWYSLTAVYG